MGIQHEPLRYAHDEGHTDVCFSSDGSHYITCGADGDMRIWSTKEGVDPSHTCVGEWSLSVREKDGNLYISTANNDVQILTFSNRERNGILDRFIAPINQIYLSRNSQHIALAGEDMEVKVYELPDNKTPITFDGLSGPCLSVAVTSHAVAASSGDGKLRIWDLSSKDLQKEIDCFPKVNSFANAASLCRLDFSADGKLLAYPDGSKVVFLDTSDWSEIFNLTCSDVTGSFSIVQFSPDGKFVAAASPGGDLVIFQVNIRQVKKISKHPNGLAICGLDWDPSGKDQIVYVDVQGQLGMATNCKTVKTMNEDIFTENEVDFGDIEIESDHADDDDNDEDNENAISVEALKREVMGEDGDEPELNFEGSSAAPTPVPKRAEIPLQEPFMPTSTPLHLNPRYLCWNEVGIMRCYGSIGDEDTAKSIEIEFHNASFHNSMMIQNFQDYFMGSLSTSAVVVANTKELKVIPLASKEWHLRFEGEFEEIQLVAASASLLAFSTSRNFLRICSIFGIQRGLVSLPGPIVSLAAHKNCILAAYHAAPVREKDQVINIRVIECNGLVCTSREIYSALSPETTLMYLGFTDVGTPAMLDSSGILNLHPLKNNVWLPFCDTTIHLKSPADGFFVTAILESSRTIIGIKCKASLYPTMTPTPIACEIPISPPFVEADTDKSQLEADLYTFCNLQMALEDKKISEVGLKAFALASKNDLDKRALELVELLQNQQLFSLASKYAVKLNKRSLAEKLTELASKLLEGEKEVDEEVTPSPVLNRIPFKRNFKPKQINESVNQSTDIDSLDSSMFNGDITIEQSFKGDVQNPFCKNNTQDESNPLSLVNKYAGVDFQAKENKSTEGKRKQELITDEPKGKQRKLDRFISKRV